jgi:hypothetical protein
VGPYPGSCESPPNLENAALDLVLLLQLLLIESQLISHKFPRAVISMLVTVGAKHDEVLQLIRSTLGPLDNTMDFKAFLRTDGAPVASLNEQLISDCLCNRHNWVRRLRACNEWPLSGQPVAAVS